MFQTIESTRSGGGLRWSALAASVVAHGIVLVAGIIMPLVFLQVLPAGDLLTFLVEPPPPPMATPPAPPPPGPQKGPETIVIRGPEFVPPENLPRGIPEPPNEPPATVGSIVCVVQGSQGVGGGELGPLGEFPRPLAVRPTLPPPPPPFPRRDPVRQGGNVQEARLVQRIDPVYPELARRVRVSGRVVLEVQVDEEGSIAEIKVLSGHPLLNDAAVHAVSQWRYAPLLLNGEPVPVIATVTVVFSLR